MTTPSTIAKPSPAFIAQSIISFGVAMVATGFGIAYLPVNPWQRSFLAIALLFVVTSAFTLAKCVRDLQDSSAVTSRVDQARLDKILTEHDPYRTTFRRPAAEPSAGAQVHSAPANAAGDTRG